MSRSQPIIFVLAHKNSDVKSIIHLAYHLPSIEVPAEIWNDRNSRYFCLQQRKE